MPKTYNFNNDRCINRNVNGKIKSITPIVNSKVDSYNQFHSLINKLKDLSNEYPQVKFQQEVNNIPSRTYKLLKEELDFNNKLTDHNKRFFYQINTNCIIIAHEVL